MINVGTCPNCKEIVPFESTKTKNVYVCPACNKEAKQHVNGKILYTKVIWDLEDNGRKD